MSPQQYYATRPAVFVGAGVLLWNDTGRLLLVKPTYEPRWVIPGGAMEPGETPRQAAGRETREELGLDREPGRLLCVDFVPVSPRRLMPGIMYLFDGGQLSPAEQAAIKLPAEELSDFRFVEVADLPDYIGGLLLRRVRAGIAAHQTGTPIDLEDGYPPDERATEL
jgi:ADP-ribose pyrophosphatase YjhB (NUDIX family)